MYSKLFDSSPSNSHRIEHVGASCKPQLTDALTEPSISPSKHVPLSLSVQLGMTRIQNWSGIRPRRDCAWFG